MKEDFDKISFQSKLFKGRSNWYFAYLKSEKLAHALAVLAERSVSDSAHSLKGIVTFAGQIVQDVVHASAGEVSEETLLADLFSMISMLRLQASRGHLSEGTSKVLVEEYAMLVERLVGDNRYLGLSVTPQDLVVPSVSQEPLSFSSISYPESPSPAVEPAIKDISKGQKGYRTQKTLKDTMDSKGQSRSSIILDFVRRNDGVSINDIAQVVRGCSNKTIQREVNTLIAQGVLVREGERRWSTYRAA